MADMIIHPERSTDKMPRQLVEREVTPGVRSWVSPGLDSKRTTLVFCHGLKANRGFFVDTAIEMEKAGYGVVLLPMPGHDVSPEDTIGFGTRESVLIKKTLDSLKSQKIVLVGCSLGGAAVWLASDHPRVNAVVSESAFARLRPATKQWLDGVLPMGHLLFAPVIWFGAARTGIDPDAVNPIEIAKKWDRQKPVLVMHAENDNTIPLDEGKALAEAVGTELWVVPKASHATCQWRGGSEYVDRLKALAMKL